MLMVGGKLNNSQELQAAWVYNLKDGTWTETTSMNRDLWLHGCGKMADGKILVAGYYDLDLPWHNGLRVEIFDTKTESWTSGPNQISALSGNFLTVFTNVGDKTILLDRFDATSGGWPIPSFEVANFYKLEKGAWAWTKIGELPGFDKYTGAAVVPTAFACN